MLPDQTQSLAYFGIAAAVAGPVALRRTGKPWSENAGKCPHRKAPRLEGH
jgi:hypothetical protein